jgi:hypothetical protein
MKNPKKFKFRVRWDKKVLTPFPHLLRILSDIGKALEFPQNREKLSITF